MQNNIAFLTSDVSRLLRKRFDVVSRRFGVTGPQWRMLAALRRTPGVNQGALAQWLEVEAITAGRMIDRMQDAKLVERKTDPADRRAWRLFLTPRGREIIDRLQPLAMETTEKTLKGISEDDQADLLRTLDTMLENLTGRPASSASWED